MKLVRFDVEEMYGVLTFGMSFFEDLSVIVGRNGSGKTSALVLISHVLRLDLEAVAGIPFKSLRLALSDEKYGEVTIAGANQGPERHLQFKFPEKELVTFPLDSTRANLGGSSFQTWIQTLFRRGTEEGLAQYGLLGIPPSLSSMESVATTLSSAIRLTFVKLDRTIVAIDPRGLEATEKGAAGLDSNSLITQRDPIEEVLAATTNHYVNYRRKLDAIKSAAAEKLLNLLFLPPDPSPYRQASIRQVKAQLAELRQRVERSALISDFSSVRDSIALFFSQTEKLVQDYLGGQQRPARMGRRTLNEEAVQILLNLKQQQINQLLNIFEEEQREDAAAFLEIARYLESTNTFLQESGKSLAFSPSLTLSFLFLEDSRIDNEPIFRHLKQLSSGERQIVIVLTYLAFMTGPNSIFIIDEPELSLHLRWQSYLIEAMRKLRPNGCQIVIATHAPEIAGRARDRCILLSPTFHSARLAND